MLTIPKTKTKETSQLYRCFYLSPAFKFYKRRIYQWSYILPFFLTVGFKIVIKWLVMIYTKCVNGYTFSKYNYPKGKPLTSNLYILNTQAPDVIYIFS